MLEEEFLTVAEAAKRLKMTTETVRRYMRQGRLHGYLPGGFKAGYRIPRQEIEELLRSSPTTVTE